MRVLLYIPCYVIDRDAQSLRVTQMTKVLGSRGWKFDIITTRAFARHDEDLCNRLQDLHHELPHLRVFFTHPGIVAPVRDRLYPAGRIYGPTVAPKVAIQREEHLGRKIYRTFLRHLYGRYHHGFAKIGDPDWIVPGVLRGLRLSSRESYQLVFASASWYFASHVAAAIVSGARGLPLVLDYGDPWGPEPPDRPKWLDRFFEGSVLRRARKAIVTNERARDLLLTQYSFVRPDRIAVIPQGYQEWSEGDVLSVPDLGSFTIVYTGSMWSGLRSSTEFLDALRVANSQGIAVKFIRAGAGLPREELEWIQRMSPGSFFQDVGHLPYLEALAAQRRATMLLVIGNRSRCQIPGKVIEYIGARRPILCLSQGPEDLAADFVKAHGLGIVVPNRVPDIVKALTELHDLWRKGRLETIYRPRDVEAFAWRYLAGDLEDIFLEAIEKTSARKTRGQLADGQREDVEGERLLVHAGRKR